MNKTVIIKVMGTYYYEAKEAYKLGFLSEGKPITLKADIHNEHDPHAVAVFAHNFKLGHISKDYAPKYQAIILKNNMVTAKVESLTFPETGNALKLKILINYNDDVQGNGFIKKFDLPEGSGVYKITIGEAGSYIGSTTNLRRRANQHLSQLKNGMHVNNILQFAFTNSDGDGFSFEVLERCQPNQLKTKEQNQIHAALNENTFLFNKTLDGRGRLNTGEPNQWSVSDKDFSRQAKETNDFPSNESLSSEPTKENEAEFVAAKEDSGSPPTLSFNLEENQDSLIQKGIVYVLKRSSTKKPNQSNICKVGFTTISGDARAKDYTDGGWQVISEFHMPIWLAKMTEKAAHKELSDHWMDPAITGGSANEVFYCEPELAEAAVIVAKDECIISAIISLNLSEKDFSDLTNKIKSEKYTNYLGRDIGTKRAEGDIFHYRNLTDRLETRIRYLETHNGYLESQISGSKSQKSASTLKNDSNKTTTHLKNKYEREVKKLTRDNEKLEKELATLKVTPKKTGSNPVSRNNAKSITKNDKNSNRINWDVNNIQTKEKRHCEKCNSYSEHVVNRRYGRGVCLLCRHETIVE